MSLPSADDGNFVFAAIDGAVGGAVPAVLPPVLEFD